MKVHLALIIATSLTAPLAGRAQIISDPTTSGGGGDDLTYDTSSDTYWVQFGVGGTEIANAYQSSPALLNPSSTGGGIVSVSAPTQANDGDAAERTQTTSGITFQYDNGTGPVSSADSVYEPDSGGYNDQAGTFSVQTGYGNNPATSGQTLTFSVDFLQAVSSATIAVIANGYNATSTLSFSFGGTPVTINDPDPSYTAGNSLSNDNAVYYVQVSDVSAGNVLTIQDELTATEGGAANISLSGFAIDVAPEPSTYAMMIGGVAMLIGIVRLRRLSA
jgi:hypothetical protein